MSGMPLTPFPPPAGLAALGSDDAGMCVDGVCAVPERADSPTDQDDGDSRPVG